MGLIDILLIYPQLGSQDTLLRDIPLSLIYAAADSIKNAYKVRILDLRLNPDDWEKQIDINLKDRSYLIGLSVMTGYPIITSLRISKYIKLKYAIPIVWGGPHPTVLPEQTLENENIDFVIRDWGSQALFELIQYIKGESGDIKNILGLGYKEEGKIVLNPPRCNFEMPDYKDLPYHLVDITSNNYNRLNNGEVIFPIFTAVGCPYACTFCMSPTVYKKIKGKKWIPYSNDYVIGHIDYLMQRYDFQRLQIYDDDSFVDLDKMYTLLSEYIKRGFQKKLKLDFRGVRINELDKMDSEYLSLMVTANVELLAIGAESGSDSSLVRMNKGITVEQILRVNKKLSKYPSLVPHYNIMCGIPGESYEDLLKTKYLMQMLVKDNASALIGAAADWKPLPGSVMTEMAVKDYNLKLPRTLAEWAKIDSLDAEKIIHPWYTSKLNNYIKLLQIAGQLLDKKIEIIQNGMRGRKFSMMKVFIILAKIYRPFLRLRLKYDFSGFLVEYMIRDLIMKLAGKLKIT
jgi:anaerobic magnesium-protoporphyrin IX monomethyl ester cyclase